jgi:enoyl-CoA hydratase/3-hydroxyacyl-CoA dehydrogenase
MVVPYRRWPAAANVFHGMLRRAERLTAARARELGIVDDLTDDVHTLIAKAVARVHALGQALPRIADGVVAIPALASIEPRAASGLTLSPTVLRLIEGAVGEAARAPTLSLALEIGYRAFGTCACTASAREGIQAFNERRAPDFTRTG